MHSELSGEAGLLGRPAHFFSAEAHIAGFSFTSRRDTCLSRRPRPPCGCTLIGAAKPACLADPLIFLGGGLPGRPAPYFRPKRRTLSARFEERVPLACFEEKTPSSPSSNKGSSCFFVFRLDFSEKRCTLNHSNISGRSSVWLER